MKPTVAAKSKSLGMFFTFIKVLLLCLAYATLWGVLWESSQAFWYLPAGLRFSILLYTRPKSWPVWIAGEWLAILYLNGAYTDNANILEGVFGNVAPSLVYVATVGLFFKKRNWTYNAVKTQSEVISIASAMFCAAIGAAVLLFFLMPNESPFLTFEKFSVQGIATYALGDTAGVLFIWSFVELIKSSGSESRLGRQLLLKDFLLVVLPILAGVIFFTLVAPKLGWAILAMLSVPIVYLSIKHGWIGAILSVVTINLFAGLLYYLNGNAEALFNTQIFLVSVGITGLFLGAAISQQAELIRDIRKISQRVIETQESERSRISQDLHDHVGQVLTALRSRIVILRQKDVTNLDSELDTLDKLAAEAYRDVHDIVDELSPNELLRFGLQRSLENTDFHQMLAAENISYHTEFESQTLEIPEHIQLAIYRIAQELLSNVSKHSQAAHCRLNIHVQKQKTKTFIDFKIQDDGIGFKIDGRTKGHGIRNVQDRVQALGGTLKFGSSETETSISIVIPF